MSFVEEIPPGLLTPAMEAARRALRLLDRKEVPVSLRKVAAHEGGRLPPPLARSLIRALDEDEWLRTKAIEEWKTADPAAPGAEGASALFLIRPEGWEFSLGRLVGRGKTREDVSGQAGLRQKLEQAKTTIAETRRRLKEVQEEAARHREQARRELEEARAEVRTVRRQDRSQEQALRAEASTAAEARRRAEEGLAEAEQTGLELRRRLHAARRDRAEYERRLTARAASSPWVGEDPLRIARFLDEVAAASRLTPGKGVTAPAAAPSTGPFGLPSGVAPDSAAAIDWLLSSKEPFTLLVDGYNVTYLVSEATFSDAAARLYLNQELAALKLRLPARTRVMVVYDSSSGEGQTVAGPGGVEVRFTSAGKLADDELRELAASVTGRVVVVSTDREVREAPEAAGAVGLWSEALVGWIRRRR